MKVRAATVEQHRFAVTRRGYDRAEVDAVMGRLSHSLRSYEEEIEQLEARLATIDRAPRAIVASFDHDALEHIRMESVEMSEQSEGRIADARQHADGLISSARSEIEKVFEAVRGDANRILEAAEQDAGKLRTTAQEQAAALIESAQAEADTIRGAATGDREQAAEELSRAKEQASAITEAAERDAEALIAKARSEHDRLAKRIPELRNALTQFEAQVHALATEEVVDLNAIERAEAAAQPSPTEEATAEPAAVAATEAEAPTEAPSAEAVPAPDGSGTLPAARDLVDLGEYRELRETPVSAEDGTEDQDDTQPAVGQEGGLERLATSHVARRAPGSESETIYQRRGGGLRRRIRAQGDE